MSEIITDLFITSKKKPVEKLVCEDYVLQGENPVPFVVVADGCSGSDFTNIGSQLLSHSVETGLKNYLHNYLNEDGEEIDTTLMYLDFGYYISSIAASAIRLLGLDLASLDSTLIVAFHCNNKIIVFMYGDGYIVSKGKNGLEINRITFERNMPYYLSYYQSSYRMSLFKEHAKDFEGIVRHNETFRQRWSGELDRVTASNDHYEKPQIWVYGVDDLDYLLLLSDGISSFTNKSNEPISTNNLIMKFIDFTMLNGGWLKRESRFFINDLKEKGILNCDDFSVAGFCIQRE